MLRTTYDTKLTYHCKPEKLYLYSDLVTIASRENNHFKLLDIFHNRFSLYVYARKIKHRGEVELRTTSEQKIIGLKQHDAQGLANETLNTVTAEKKLKTKKKHKLNTGEAEKMEVKKLRKLLFCEYFSSSNKKISQETVGKKPMNASKRKQILKYFFQISQLSNFKEKK